jgi:hypothetical protein
MRQKLLPLSVTPGCFVVVSPESTQAKLLIAMLTSKKENTMSEDERRAKKKVRCARGEGSLHRRNADRRNWWCARVRR